VGSITIIVSATTTSAVTPIAATAATTGGFGELDVHVDNVLLPASSDYHFLILVHSTHVSVSFFFLEGSKVLPLTVVFIFAGLTDVELGFGLLLLGLLGFVFL